MFMFAKNQIKTENNDEQYMEYKKMKEKGKNLYYSQIKCTFVK